MQELTLYDIQSKVGAYSFTTWRARYALGYKRLPFRTVWVEIPDIRDVCIRIGAPPTNKWPDDSDCYTLPVVQDPNTGRIVSDSFKIALYLDDVYPEAPLLFPHRDLGLQRAFQDCYHCSFLSAITKPLRHKSLSAFDERTKAYLDRQPGIELGRMSAGDTNQAMGKAKEALGWVQTCILANGDDAVFLAGEMLSYSDLVVVASLKWLSKASADDWDMISSWHGGRWRRLLLVAEQLVPTDIEDR
ncbi:hypothetical protein HDZ31DRAFT_39292 [Schizophyllum fasciatum]